MIAEKTIFDLKYFKAEIRQGSSYVRVDYFKFQEPIEDHATLRKVWKEYLAFFGEIKAAGFKGWVGSTRTDNLRFRKFLNRIGVREYGMSNDGVYVFLMKEV